MSKIDWDSPEFTTKPKSMASSSSSINWDSPEFTTNPHDMSDESDSDYEETGLSAAFSDLLSGALGASDFVADIPKMSGALLEQSMDDPLEAIPRQIRNFVAGTADLAKGTINSPKDIANYISKKELDPASLAVNLFFPKDAEKELIEHPKTGSEIVSNLLPSPQQYARMFFDQLKNSLIKSEVIPGIPENTGVEHALGMEPQEGDKLVRSLPGVLALGKGITSGIKATKNNLKQPDLKKGIRATQQKVNELDANLSEAFDKIENQVIKRDIPNVKIDKNLIKNAKIYLDKSPETNKLIKNAMQGDYKALRNLQADLRVISENSLSNKLSSERAVGLEAKSIRNKINESIENHLNKTGNEDLANELNKIKEGYRKLNDVYYSDPKLKKVFGEKQEVPKDILSFLKTENQPMKKLFQEHPELEQLLKDALKNKRNKKFAINLLKVLGTGTSGGIVYKILDKI